LISKGAAQLGSRSERRTPPRATNESLGRVSVSGGTSRGRDGNLAGVALADREVLLDRREYPVLWWGAMCEHSPKEGSALGGDDLAIHLDIELPELAFLHRYRATEALA
jgi:hypothetical protein